ncbi:hypothetical protein JCM3765_000558 [Sporobolomyces pararoseus]
MSATSPSSALGQCVVCGKESVKGCSSCKAVGLNWMYFCSVEHQKLIWKSHKFVCGKNPFEFPPLSAKEVEQIWEARHDTSLGDRSLSDVLRKTLEFILIPNLTADSFPLSDDQVDAALRLQLDKLGAEDSTDPTRQGPLQVYRGILFGSKLEKIQGSDNRAPAEQTQLLISDHPVAFMAFVERIVPIPILNSSWYQTSFRHRVFVVIGALAASKGSSNGPVEEALEWSLNRVVHFSEEYKPQVDSESARFLNETFIPGFMDLIGFAVLR